MTDPVSDMVTRIKNAVMADKDVVAFQASKVKANICKILKEEGYIRSFKIVAKSKSDITIKVALKGDSIVDIKRVSKPGLRVYRGYRDVPRVASGLGVSILSTSKGVISSRDCKKLKIGGEILCSVW